MVALMIDPVLHRAFWIIVALGCGFGIYAMWPRRK